MTTTDLTMEFLQRLGLQVKHNQDYVAGHFKELFAAVIASVAEAEAVLRRLMQHHVSETEVSPVALLFTNAIGDVAAALHVLQAGSFRPTTIVCRGALETPCIAIASGQDPGFFGRWQGGKQKASSAVSTATKVFPEAGRLYGDMSNGFVHETFPAIGRSLSPNSQSAADWHICPPLGDSNPSWFVEPAGAVGMTASLIGRAAEYYLSKPDDELVYVNRVENGFSKRLSPAEIRLGLALKPHVDKISNSPTEGDSRVIAEQATSRCPTR